MSMNDFDVARVARWMLGTFTRRNLFSVVLVTVGLPRQIPHPMPFSQLTCRVSGDVCAPLLGCCEGLSCATSRINTNFGVCVTAVADDGTADATTDAEAARLARIQEKKARLAERKDRKHDAEVRRRANKQEQHDRRRDNRRDETTPEPTPTP